MKTIPQELISQLRQEIHTVCYLFEISLDLFHPWYGGSHANTHRWTDFDSDIYYSSQWYHARPIRFVNIQNTYTNTVDLITLEIDNIDKFISTIVLNSDNPDIRGKPVTIKQVALDNNNAVINAVTIFYGYIDGMEITQKVARIDVASHMIKWKTITPRRMASGSCPWIFKDVASQVTGTDAINYKCVIEHLATSCNRPITGSAYATYWTAAGTSGATWSSGTQYEPGTCQYTGASTWCDQSWERCSTLGNDDNFGGFRWLPYLSGKNIWWGRTQGAKD